jgi:hypothetical protein
MFFANILSSYLTFSYFLTTFFSPCAYYFWKHFPFFSFFLCWTNFTSISIVLREKKRENAILHSLSHVLFIYFFTFFYAMCKIYKYICVFFLKITLTFIMFYMGSNNITQFYIYNYTFKLYTHTYSTYIYIHTHIQHWFKLMLANSKFLVRPKYGSKT